MLITFVFFDNNTTVYKLCYAHVAYTSRGNTANIAEHLRRYGKEVDLTEKTTLLTSQPFRPSHRAEHPQNLKQ